MLYAKGMKDSDSAVTADNTEKTLLIAAKLGNVKGITSALGHGVDIQCINAFDETPLHIAVRFGQKESAEKLISQKALLHAKDIVGNQPIHTAATYGKTSCIQLLIETKPDLLTAVNKRSETPLHLAVRNGHKECVEKLLELGASLQAKDSIGDTPLHCSIKYGKKECLETLLEHGATVYVLNRANQTPAETAKDFGEWKLLEILEKYEFQGLLTEISGLGVETVEEFKDMLRAGSYKCFWNRVYLAGPYNVGKTTLAKSLVGDPVSEIRESTDGIWIYLGRAGMDTEERKWIFLNQRTALNATVQSFLMTSKKEEKETPTSNISDEDESKKEEIADNSSNEDESEVTSVTIPKFSKDQPEQVQNKDDDKTVEDHVLISENRQPDIVIVQLQQADQMATKDEGEQQKEDKNEQIMKLVMAACKKGEYKMKIVPIDLWDFGGQKIYYMTHQLFISSRGTFVVVFNGSVDIHKELTELAYLPGQHGKRTIAVYLMHWVNSILTYCQTSKEGFPQILFVATHKDLVTNVEKRREKLTESIEKLFENDARKSHLKIRPLIFVNAKNKEDPEMDNLRTKLVESAFSHPRWGEPMPTLFVPLELQLDECVKNGIKIMKKTEIKELNDEKLEAENETMALKDSQMETFLKLQHAVGKYIYFDQDCLKDYVVIDPTYLIEVLRSVVTEKQFWPKDKELQGIFDKLSKKGEIRKVDLLKIWEQKEFSHILPFKEYMIDMLLHLDIIIEPRSSITTTKTEISEEEKFFVPCMITQPNKTPVKESGIHMAYTFIEEIIPPAFLYRFIGAFVSMWTMKNLYTDSAVVSIDNEHELTVNVDKNRIVVTLVHTKSKKDIVPTTASTVQECLTRAIIIISQFYWKASDSDSSTESATENLKMKSIEEFTDATNSNKERSQKKIIPFSIEFGVYCNSGLCFFAHHKVSDFREWNCHGITHNIKELEFWFAKKSDCYARKDEGLIVCTEDCTGLEHLERQRCPSDQHLGRLARDLEVDVVRNLCLGLNLQNTKIEGLYESYKHNIDDFKFFALHGVKQQNYNLTYQKLSEALTNVIGQKEHKLCEVFRELDIEDIPEEELNVPLKDEFLMKLSNNIGKNVLQLGIELEIKGAELEQIESKHKSNLVMQGQEILTKFKEMDESNPLKCLAKACKRIDIIGTFGRCLNQQ